MSNSHTKFGCSSPNGLGGDSITDRRTDEAITISPSLFKENVGIRKLGVRVFVVLLYVQKKNRKLLVGMINTDRDARKPDFVEIRWKNIFPSHGKRYHNI